jgi:hypothetical protein
MSCLIPVVAKQSCNFNMNGWGRVNPLQNAINKMNGKFNMKIIIFIVN